MLQVYTLQDMLIQNVLFFKFKLSREIVPTLDAPTSGSSCCLTSKTIASGLDVVVACDSMGLSSSGAKNKQ